MRLLAGEAGPTRIDAMTVAATRRTDGLRRRHRPLRPGARAGSPRRAVDRHQDVLRLPDDLRRRAQHPGLPGVPGPARCAAGAQRGRRRVGHPHRARAELLDRPVGPVRAQELLLPGPAEELPDQPVRRTDRVRRLPRRATGRRQHLPGRHRARAHGGGHRQAHRTSAATPAASTVRPLAAGLQPRRRAADRDRHQADRGRRGARPRGRPRLCDRAAGPVARRWTSPTSGWTRARCAATPTCR